MGLFYIFREAFIPERVLITHEDGGKKIVPADVPT